MREQIKFVSLWFVVSVLCVVAVSQTNRVANATSQQDVMKSLLDEVHLLRLAIERNTASTAQSQVFTARLNSQQERVNTVSRELENTRGQLSEVPYATERVKMMLEEVEKKVGVGAADPANLKELKAEIAQQLHREQDLKEKESRLAMELESERARLREMNQQLDDALKRLLPASR